jgi:hypothetical protein
MTDLNMMMREQARAGFQSALDTAVTNGDTEAARKAAKDLETLAVQTAPKAPPFGNEDIKAELDKQSWFGIDPKRSARVVELGKTMDPKKFATAAAFAEALVKAVEEEFPAKRTAAASDDDANEGDDDAGGEGDDDTAAAGTPPKKKKTDGPGESDNSQRAAPRRTNGPWVKMSDAPPDVQKEIKRQADKFVSTNAPKEQREKFIAGALESHYQIAQRAKGKK